ncbi:MAG: type 1 glutamine amidotransferase [Geobacter sp.]|nr:type 1 glutamine amidotransferase [Geobacter sp.]
MLHIIQNDPEVPPGNITENLDILETMYFIHYPYQGDPLPDLRDVTSLVVLGGAMGANDDERYPFLKQLKTFIGKIVERQIPYLGICLGGQLLSAACGGRAVSGRWEELGTLSVDLTEEGKLDRLFSGIEDRFTTFQWHHDSFDIPPGAALLAGSPACPHQAFRIGNCAWGTQFHPEVSESIIRNWCAWDPKTKERADELATEWQNASGYAKTARLILENFLKMP